MFIRTFQTQKLWKIVAMNAVSLQLSLLPTAGEKMSTGQSAVMLCGWGVKAGIVHSTCGCTGGWQVKLCDPSLTRAIPERMSFS